MAQINSRFLVNCRTLPELIHMEKFAIAVNDYSLKEQIRDAIAAKLVGDLWTNEMCSAYRVGSNRGMFAQRNIDGIVAVSKEFGISNAYEIDAVAAAFGFVRRFGHRSLAITPDDYADVLNEPDAFVEIIGDSDESRGKTCAGFALFRRAATHLGKNVVCAVPGTLH